MCLPSRQISDTVQAEPSSQEPLSNTLRAHPDFGSQLSVVQGLPSQQTVDEAGIIWSDLESERGSDALGRRLAWKSTKRGLNRGPPEMEPPGLPQGSPCDAVVSVRWSFRLPSRSTPMFNEARS